ncbi:MAG: hypothetical protein SGPRY_013476 [Prymnesium sp.]
MSVGKVRGAGVPTLLGHLESASGSACSRVWYPAGEAAGAAEAVVVKLLGGSKPGELAEIRKEGGVILDGTLGSLTGKAAHSSVRSHVHIVESDTR